MHIKNDLSNGAIIVWISSVLKLNLNKKLTMNVWLEIVKRD